MKRTCLVPTGSEFEQMLRKTEGGCNLSAAGCEEAPVLSCRGLHGHIKGAPRPPHSPCPARPQRDPNQVNPCRAHQNAKHSKEHDVTVPACRLFYAGARERQLPALLAMIHLERRTPGPALLVTCLSTLLMLGAGDVTALVSYVGFVNHLWYGVAVAALLVLRRRDPHRPRPFRVPTVLPVLYLLLWGWLGGAALLREPLLCGLGLGVSLLPAPLYLLAMRGKGPRLPALRRACDAVTHFGQRLFLVVYPQPSPQGDDPTTRSDDLTPHGDNPMTHSDDPAPHSNPWQPLTSQPHS